MTSTETPRILIVEDNKLDADLLIQVIREAAGPIEVDCESVATATGAMSILARGEPLDFVLIDLGLPDEDGLALAKEFSKRLPAGRDAICLWTGASPSEVDVDGEWPIVTKPFGLEALRLFGRSVLETTLDAAAARKGTGES